MYYKLAQACVTNWGNFVLLQVRENLVTNWGSFIITVWGKRCYKLRQPLLQNRAAIANWGKIFHKLGYNNITNVFYPHQIIFEYFQVVSNRLEKYHWLVQGEKARQMKKKQNLLFPQTYQQ